MKQVKIWMLFIFSFALLGCDVESSNSEYSCPPTPRLDYGEKVVYEITYPNEEIITHTLEEIADNNASSQTYYSNIK